MEVIYLVLTFLLCIELSNSSAASVSKESEDRCDDDCSFCPSYHGDWYQLKCTSSSVQLSIGYCITVDANENLFVTKCPYFQLEGHNVSDPGNFKLPDNTSELNDYICGPMNRKGFLCKDCIDGFAVSFTSMGHKCSNCTDAWYGIPLYLLIELAPTTVFYLIILIFQIHITSSPMTSIILYCSIIQFLLVTDRYPPIERIVPQYENNLLFKVNAFFYSLLNLDFLRYVLPPFCVSKNFKLIHTMLLGCVSVLYPLCLIALTWVCIKLHDENFRPIVCLWQPLHRYLVKLRRGYTGNSKNDIIGVFSAFFLLSYSKSMFQISFFLSCIEIRNISEGNYYLVMEYDASVHCSGSRNYQVAVPALLFVCIFNILPALLLVFYPIKVFRKCLSRCKLDNLSLTAFTEKFYRDYRDGLDDGRDMRSFAGFYFLLRYLPFLYYGLRLQYTFLNLWIYCVLIFLSSALIISLIQPYKKTYMNVVDTLLLALLAYTCAVLSQRTLSAGMETHLSIIFCIPSLVLVLILIYLLSSVLMKLCRWITRVVTAKYKSYRNCSLDEPDDQLQPILDNPHSRQNFHKIN